MVFECGLGPQCLAWHTWRCPCIRGQKCEARLRAPEGCSVSSNNPSRVQAHDKSSCWKETKGATSSPMSCHFEIPSWQINEYFYQKNEQLWVSTQTWSAVEVAIGGSGCAVAKCWMYCAPSAPVVTTCWPICWRGWKSRNVSLFYWSHLTKYIGNFKQNRTVVPWFRALCPSTA